MQTGKEDLQRSCSKLSLAWVRGGAGINPGLLADCSGAGEGCPVQAQHEEVRSCRHTMHSPSSCEHLLDGYEPLCGWRSRTCNNILAQPSGFAGLMQCADQQLESCKLSQLGTSIKDAVRNADGDGQAEGWQAAAGSQSVRWQ